jgi:hypothetical protein
MHCRDGSDKEFMGYRALLLRCSCGEVPERILEVGLTSDRQIVVHFWCETCNRVFYMCKSLDECAVECPPPGEDAAMVAAAADARFLESLGIAVE